MLRLCAPAPRGGAQRVRAFRHARNAPAPPRCALCWLRIRSGIRAPRRDRPVKRRETGGRSGTEGCKATTRGGDSHVRAPANAPPVASSAAPRRSTGSGRRCCRDRVRHRCTVPPAGDHCRRTPRGARRTPVLRRRRSRPVRHAGRGDRRAARRGRGAGTRAIRRRRRPTREGRAPRARRLRSVVTDAVTASLPRARSVRCIHVRRPGKR